MAIRCALDSIFLSLVSASDAELGGFGAFFTAEGLARHGAGVRRRDNNKAPGTAAGQQTLAG